MFLIAYVCFFVALKVPECYICTCGCHLHFCNLLSMPPYGPASTSLIQMNQEMMDARIQELESQLAQARSEAEAVPRLVTTNLEVPVGPVTTPPTIEIGTPGHSDKEEEPKLEEPKVAPPARVVCDNLSYQGFASTLHR